MRHVDDVTSWSTKLCVALVDRLTMFHQVMFMLELFATQVAVEAWLDAAFHALVKVQRLAPLIRSSAAAAEFSIVLHHSHIVIIKTCNSNHLCTLIGSQHFVLALHSRNCY